MSIRFDETWWGVHWPPVVDGVCSQHTTSVGVVTGLCWRCHVDQLDAARRGSREHERLVEGDEAGTNSFVGQAPDGTLPLFTGDGDENWLLHSVDSPLTDSHASSGDASIETEAGDVCA